MTAYATPPFGGQCGVDGRERLMNAAIAFAATASTARQADDVQAEVIENTLPVSSRFRAHEKPRGARDKDLDGLSCGHVFLIGDANFEWLSEYDDAKPQMALIGYCHDNGNRLWDAWTFAGEPRRVATLWGRTCVNSEHEALRLRADEPLAIHRNPLKWLRAGCKGVFITDRRRAPHFLKDCGPFLAEDILHGEEIERAFAEAGLLRPRIVVPPPVGVAR